MTILLGDGVVHQGEWLDVECVGDIGMFSICERDKMSVDFYITIYVLFFIINIIVIKIIISNHHY